MNNNNNTPFWPTWRPANAYRGYPSYPASYDSNTIQPIFRHSFSFQPTTDPVRGSRDDPWRLLGPESPFGFSVFSDYQRATTPVEIAWVDTFPARAVNPRFSGPLPRTPTRQVSLRLNEDEQNDVVGKLKKEIYNPIPKQMTKRLNSYYRGKKQGNEKKMEIDEDGKRCAVCLEDFVAREQVMVTPCEHMFHEHCILPWVKSHGQCPVCRFVLSERIKRTNSNVQNVPGNDLFQGEVMAIMRAMEEAFLWGNSL
ncbi:hypothetical protein ERO13_D05G319300v2 [Gossypium hirsutum]|uniref:RING-type domain-containing protein n=1 Tax=Gossypium hirsutum TaxID=3635 RepID=A0A1U8JY25_GOSHI|nr:uncharacterized protein LOC107911762 [Gossypium hirsutum]KAG4149042.1 hypothetical protein ERO13_D05G319300v2 [Gossypium hirsutum]